MKVLNILLMAASNGQYSVVDKQYSIGCMGSMNMLEHFLANV